MFHNEKTTNTKKLNSYYCFFVEHSIEIDFSDRRGRLDHFGHVVFRLNNALKS